jgi:bacillithiol biosynthesis cysteine-adding enzyme BshC
LTLRILSTPLKGSSLARIAIAGERVSPWFASRPSSGDEWKARGTLICDSLIVSDWRRDLADAFAARGKAAERLARAGDSGFVVTAGQQPGLFGGPLYTWWKVLSIVALADRLEKLTGLPVAPVFWAATDDSDFAEASHTVVAVGENAERIEISGDASETRTLSEIPVGDLSAQLRVLAEAAGSAPNARVLEVVREAYSPPHTLGSAYLGLLREVVEPLGVSVLDASHPVVRAAAYPLLRKALEQSGRIEEALATRSAELKAQGHSAQVKPVTGRSLVFRNDSGNRDRIRTRDAVSALEDATAGSLSPNVLLRPIVERSILPTVAYMGGPAEVAYFAQVTAVADALEVPAPLVVPRWSGVVIEPRIQRILEKHSLSVEDFRDPHAVETRMARASVPDDIRQEIQSLSATMNESAARLATAEGADLVPPGVVDGLKRNVAHRLARLERRYAAGLKHRGTEDLRDAAIARASLFPLGVPQERALNGIPMIARYGDELFHAVMEEARKHAANLA